MSGLNFDYEYGGQLFGYLNVVLAVVKNYLMMKNSEFNYSLEYMGDKKVAFKGIVYSKMGIILKQVFGGN